MSPETTRFSHSLVESRNEVIFSVFHLQRVRGRRCSDFGKKTLIIQDEVLPSHLVSCDKLHFLMRCVRHVPCLSVTETFLKALLYSPVFYDSKSSQLSCLSHLLIKETTAQGNSFTLLLSLSKNVITLHIHTHHHLVLKYRGETGLE